MISVLNAKNLQKGIKIWHKTTWPSDFHNQFYQELHRRKQSGLNTAWWSPTVDNLWRWKAIRPLPKAPILSRGLASLPRLQAEYTRIQSTLGNQVPSLSNLAWNDVCGLYQLAYQIKNANSPVFGSKLCHFLMPDAFPVMDKGIIDKVKAIGINTGSYQHYWGFCRAQWVGCTAQAHLVGMLQQEIRNAAGPNIYAHYPYAAKITELCISGS
jgi:hypothetical protein